MAAADLERQLAALRPSLLAIARLQLRNDAWAEDAVSETIVAALEGARGFAAQSQLKTWVVGILKHKIIDQFRRTKHEISADAEAEGEELPPLVLAPIVVRLVGDDDDVMAAAAQPAGDRLVLVGHAHRRVDDEQHDVGPPHGRLDLPADLGVEVAATRHPTAGVDDPERDAEPLGLELLAVTGDAGTVLDDGRLLTDDPVEQRALADVGPAHDGDDRKVGGRRDLGTHWRPSRA